MLQDIIIIDNIFFDPDKIVDFANQQTYEENDSHLYSLEERTYWRGKRTKELHKIDNLEMKKITDIFFHSIFHNNFPKSDKYDLNYTWNTSFFFHRMDNNLKCQYKWIHKDASLYAGVVYLNKNPPSDSGTFIIKKDEIIPIKNKYNRLVLYNSDYLHSPMNGFGEGENSRLTMAIFIDGFSIEMRKK